MDQNHLTATIQSLGARGEGIATAGTERVFVPFALPGEVVELARTGERAELLNVLEPSPERVEPFCPYFGGCGGCQVQHLGPDLYSTFKRDLLLTPLRRAGLDAEVGALVAAHGRGRRRATLHARAEGAGFMRLRSHQVYDIARCPILVPELASAADITRAVFAAIGEADVAFTATATGIDIAIRTERSRARGDRLLPLAQRFGLARMALNGEVIAQQAVPVMRIGRARVELPVGSFLQATELAEETLAELVITALGRVVHVADLFSGLGPFTLRLAETCRVAAFDSDKAAIAALGKAHRTTQGLKPVTALARDLFREPLRPEELDRFDAVIVDPPRAGAERQARELVRSRIRRVVSVSCDAKTFARDAAILVGGGFRLERVVPVDQFAWSSHIESVATFRR